MAPVFAILGYALIPALGTVLAALAAAFRMPGASLRSGFQHFAAGVIFAVAAVELLPEVRANLDPIALGASFSLGVAFMLALRSVTERLEHRAQGHKRLPLPFLTAVALDITLDGVLLGIGFALGEKAGLLLATALTMEGLAIGVVVAVALMQGGLPRRRTVGVILGLGLLWLVTACIGGLLLGHLSGRLTESVLAFGLAALLYLVTEELLVEAHEVPETPVSAALFFAGFLVLLVLGMVI